MLFTLFCPFTSYFFSLSSFPPWLAWHILRLSNSRSRLVHRGDLSRLGKCVFPVLGASLFGQLRCFPCLSLPFLFFLLSFFSFLFPSGFIIRILSFACRLFGLLYTQTIALVWAVSHFRSRLVSPAALPRVHETNYYDVYFYLLLLLLLPPSFYYFPLPSPGRRCLCASLPFFFFFFIPPLLVSFDFIVFQFLSCLCLSIIT